MQIRNVLTFGLLGCTLMWGAEWRTDGGNPQRTAWQQNEKILNKDNVKGMKLLWKIKLDNVPQEMHSLFAPLIVENVPTKAGKKQIAVVSGISDNLYAIDVETGKLIWKKHFEYPTPARRGREGDPLCPPGATAAPVINEPTTSGDRIVYMLAGDGKLHSLNVADGEVVAPPFPFGYPNGKHYSLNLWKDTLFTTTAQGCAGNPNQIWAVNLKDPAKKIMTFNPKSGGLWGRSGAAIDSSGTAWAPTGDGRYDPDNKVYGNGLIGAGVEGNELKLRDWFEPSNWIWLQKRDLDFQVTPAIFPFKDKELMVTGSKECRVYLLDTKSAGGKDHLTPLVRTPLMCNEEVDFQSAGIWGSMASWQDSKGTRWALTPFWGPVHPDFKPPINHGPVQHGAVVAFKVNEKGGKYELNPAWISRDMDQAEPPVIANGVVYAYASGENTRQAYPDKGLADFSPLRIAASKHATLYALDAETGKELYNSGKEIDNFVHFGALSVANGRVYIGDFGSTLYCFGLPGK
ncbi:PQQ-binding-like beta-propeller repeat protein [Bryobacter aggregatus]|uniref:outer membrane protein assembly factor BamB family protein n=1 Tax=Bryobacter aggregatus TaxID=360054 RepID=UPI0004E1BAE8|nr:PQQ-binding-like beta-propeller repeat protein [Bryobacter aggregatus]